jgi:hypothetical protein
VPSSGEISTLFGSENFCCRVALSACLSQNPVSTYCTGPGKGQKGDFMQLRHVAVSRTAGALLGVFVTVSVAGAADVTRLRGVSARRSSAHEKWGGDLFQSFTFKIPGAVFNTAVEINNRGTVGGVAVYADGRTSTFTWDAGQINYFNRAGATITAIPAITDSGLLFGNWGSNTEQTAGWYDPKHEEWKELPPFPGKNINIGARMTNSGRAVGQACNGTFAAPENCVAWIWDRREYQVFSVVNGKDTVPQGINERGQIVGLWLDSPPFDFKPFLYDNGAVSTLLVNGGVSATAFDITNSGEVLMLAELNPQDFFMPVLYRAGVSTPLPLYTGALQTLYNGINERGDLVGVAFVEGFEPLVLISLKK